MDRNTENHFAYLPETEIGRSKFTRNFTHKTTFNTGDLFVIDWQEILPGDTVNMDMSSLVRLQTPIAPVLDNLYLDTYWFFVPNRLIWDNWVNFMGENTNAWKQTNSYTVPKLQISDNYDQTGVQAGSLANYMGIPIGLGKIGQQDTKTIKVNHLPFRAYCKIWNDWFRSTATQKELYFSTGNSLTYMKSLKDAKRDDDKYTQNVIRGAICAKANKFHDVFTSALPEPQEGPQTLVPIIGEAPIIRKTVGTESYVNNLDGLNPAYKETVTYENGQYTVDSKKGYSDGLMEDTSDFEVEITSYPLTSGTYAWNPVVDMENAVGATVNAIRQAFAIQKFYERTARGGNRYIEQIQSHFNTTNPDFRLQRSEYLGGATRIPISINQVIQTVGDQSEGTPLGNTGAYSVTSDVSTDMWTHSFTEHGILMCVACARTDHTYQQGIAKKFFKNSIFDYYWPELANLGEQPLYLRELYAQDGTTDKIAANETVFAYQEAWSEYRYEKDIVTGELSSMYDDSLDIWTYADYYSTAPTLNEEFMRETDQNVKRTLAVQTGHQFLGDFYIRGTWTRPMPLYSVPGLVDHH